MISIIVAKSSNNVIGASNELPWYVPADLKRFRSLTNGHTVVMGRKTFESIVARLGRPLPARRNVVVSRDQTFRYDGVEVIHSLDDLPSLGDDMFILGGSQIYDQALSRVDRLYVTEIHAVGSGDCYFPAIDPQSLRQISREKHASDDSNPYSYDFVVYDRIA